MRGLYITDRYAWDVFGVKRSLFEALAQHMDIELSLKNRLIMGRALKQDHRLRQIHSGRYSHVFFAHTTLGYDPQIMRRLRHKVRLIGFGFSDPRWLNLTKRHWKSFYHYFSLSPKAVELARQHGVPASVMLPSIHEGYHDVYTACHQAATVDSIFLGKIGGHPDAMIRKRMVDKVKECGLSVSIINGLSGLPMIKALSKARIGLNAMGATSTLAHRLFEYAACGLCVASTPNPEIDAAFTRGSEYHSLETTADFEALHSNSYCATIGAAAKKRCLKDHTMSKRVADIMQRI